MNSKFESLKQNCYTANIKLKSLGLVVYTFGNVSAVDREHEVFAIKPSGVSYDKLQTDDMVIVDFENNPIEGLLKPYSDTE